MGLRIKKVPFILLIVLIIVSFIGICYNILLYINREKVSEEEVLITIPVGATTQEVGLLLGESEIISSSSGFVLCAKVMGKEKKIKAGRYVLKKGMGIKEVLNILIKGETKKLTVTVPEGLTIDEIAIIVAKQVKIDKEQFIKLAKDKKYTAGKGITGKNLEGFLYPDTYEFNYDVTEKEIIERFVGQFWTVFNDSLKERSEEIGFSVQEVVILASMIEEEAMLDSEKAIISQVYHKRLKLDRALECDATIQYALPSHKSRLLYKDLKIKSPYNTYLHKGLPPGPISNPGESAIIAALYPRDTDYLYYVAKGDGTHIFSRTAKEHMRAIARLHSGNK